jgi:hypothetical protein
LLLLLLGLAALAARRSGLRLRLRHVSVSVASG